LLFGIVLGETICRKGSVDLIIIDGANVDQRAIVPRLKISSYKPQLPSPRRQLKNRTMKHLILKVVAIPTIMVDCWCDFTACPDKAKSAISLCVLDPAFTACHRFGLSSGVGDLLGLPGLQGFLPFIGVAVLSCG
jgi:hypothetical protein